MEQFVQALWGLAASVLVALAPIAFRLAKAYADLLAQQAAATLQQRLGEAAGRVAGEIAGEVRASPEVQLATQQMLVAGADALRSRFQETVAKAGIPISTLEGMIAGELGKLGVAVTRR